LKIHLNIITHLRLGLPSGLFPIGFPTKTLHTLLLSPYALHASPTSFFSIITRKVLNERYRLLSSSLCSFLHSRYLVPLRPKCSPQRPILTFSLRLSLCERPNFTPIQNNRQNYNSLYFIL
jgi:hypothetical protein